MRTALFLMLLACGCARPLAGAPGPTDVDSGSTPPSDSPTTVTTVPTAPSGQDVACTTDADCAITPDSCCRTTGGPYYGINVSAKDAYLEQTPTNCSTTLCTASAPHLGPMGVFCLSSRCTYTSATNVPCDADPTRCSRQGSSCSPATKSCTYP